MMIAGAFSVKISYVDSDTESPHGKVSRKVPRKGPRKVPSKK